MNIPGIISSKSVPLFELCLRLDVAKLYAFGSVLTDRFDEESSDLDFLVELMPMSPLARGESLLELWDELEKIFDRRIDLVSDQPIQNPILAQQINKTKQLIYDRASEEVPDRPAVGY